MVRHGRADEPAGVKTRPETDTARDGDDRPDGHARADAPSHAETGSVHGLPVGQRLEP
jgi:hypothetical protein